MSYLVDSDWLIDYLAREAHAVALLESLLDAGAAMSVASFIELVDGVQRAADPDHELRRLERLVRDVPVINLDRDIGETCARLRHHLRAEKRRVNSRAMDLLVAATAIHFDLTLVTRNIDDYKDIPGLKLHDATAPDAPPAPSV